MRTLRSIFKDLMDPNLPADIISPWGAMKLCAKWAMVQKERFVAHTREVKAAQIAFQEGIQNAGIDRISKMTTQQILNEFARPPEQRVYELD